MKILQKIIWTRYLIIGISVAISALNASCDKGQVEYILTTNFVYKNLTSEPVELSLYDFDNKNFKNYSIEKGSEITISLEQDGGKTGVGEPFYFSGTQWADKLVMRFTTSNKCLINPPKIKNVKKYDNFSESMYNTSNNTLIYNIDKEELDLATACP